MSNLATEILAALTDRGFQAESLNSDARGEVFRVQTSRGVTYERFKDLAAVPAWALRHKPETDR